MLQVQDGQDAVFRSGGGAGGALHGPAAGRDLCTGLQQDRWLRVRIVCQPDAPVLLIWLCLVGVSLFCISAGEVELSETVRLPTTTAHLQGAGSRLLDRGWRGVF